MLEVTFSGKNNIPGGRSLKELSGIIKSPKKKNIWIFWRGRSWSVVFFSNLCLAQKTTPKTPTTPHLLERGFFHWFPGIQSIKITRKDICNCGLDPPSCVDWDGSPSWTVWLEALTGGAETLFTYDCSLYHSSPCLLVSSSRKKKQGYRRKTTKSWCWKSCCNKWWLIWICLG